MIYPTMISGCMLVLARIRRERLRPNGAATFVTGTNDKLFCGVETTGDYLLNPPKRPSVFVTDTLTQPFKGGTVDFYPALDTWYHLEWVRSGSSFMIL